MEKVKNQKQNITSTKKMLVTLPASWCMAVVVVVFFLSPPNCNEARTGNSPHQNTASTRKALVGNPSCLWTGGGGGGYSRLLNGLKTSLAYKQERAAPLKVFR